MSKQTSRWSVACALIGILFVCPSCKAQTNKGGGSHDKAGNEGSSIESSNKHDTETTTHDVVLRAQKAERDMGEPLAVDSKLDGEATRVYTDPGQLPSLKVATGDKRRDLPLKHTHVSSRITGHVAEVEVAQTYENPFPHPIEAIYVFPLPENSAVHNMKMVIGRRVIESEVQKRAEARRTYEEAKKDGHTAALLEQERPNVFSQSVANIEPGSMIDVIVRYVQTLTYDAGEYEFVFPMVVGPRFFPGAPTGTKSGSGFAADTTEVPDASRISPPILGRGLRTGHDISLEVDVEAGFDISEWSVPTHAVDAKPGSGGALEVSLSEKDDIPNRDFVLRYRVADEKAQAVLFVDEPSEGEAGAFSLLVQPPSLDIEEVVGRREMIFVVDVSGSMFGRPLAMCKQAMEYALERLRPVDTFNVITFAGRAQKLYDASRPANDANIRQALSLVGELRARGGTMMLDGVSEAFKTDVEPGRSRYVFFLTDGYVGNESSIHAAAREFVGQVEGSGGRAKVFGFGVGSSVNRHLIGGLADAGKGLAVYAANREDPYRAVEQYFHVVDHPVLEDVKVNWGDVEVDEVYPVDAPDLFASRPLVLHGRYEGEIEGNDVELVAKSAGRTVRIRAALRTRDHIDTHMVSTLWAREKIDWLEKELTYAGTSAGHEDTITRLGLEYHLVTRFTSLVAVDRSKKINGKSRRIVQPVEVPEDVDPVMAGAGHAKMARRYSRAKAGRTGNYAAQTLHGGLAGAEAQSLSDSSVGYGRGGGGLGGSSAPSARAFPLKGNAVVTGTLHKRTVYRVIRRHMAQLTSCYQSELRKDPTLEGRIVVAFTIDERGRITSAKIQSSTLGSAVVENCLKASMRSWRFPAPRGEVQVTYPFVFKP